MFSPQPPIRRLLGEPQGLIAPYVSRTRIGTLPRLSRFEGPAGACGGRRQGRSTKNQSPPGSRCARCWSVFDNGALVGASVGRVQFITITGIRSTTNPNWLPRIPRRSNHVTRTRCASTDLIYFTTVTVARIPLWIRHLTAYCPSLSNFCIQV